MSYQSAEIKAVFKRFELMPRHGKISLGTIEHKVQEYLAVVAQGADKVVTLTQADKNIFYLIICSSFDLT